MRFLQLEDVIFRPIFPFVLLMTEMEGGLRGASIVRGIYKSLLIVALCDGVLHELAFDQVFLKPTLECDEMQSFF